MVIEKPTGLVLQFDPFKEGHKLKLKLDGIKSKRQSLIIQTLIENACRTGDYGILTGESRAACIRLFTRKSWELPPELGGAPKALEPQGELTLWRAVEMFMTSPEIVEAPGKWRYKISIVHLVEYFGKDRPIKEIWVPELKTYQHKRTREGAAADTVNRELSCLSRIFVTLGEHRLIEANPLRLMKSLSAKAGERQVYLSLEDVSKIAEKTPVWYQPLIWTAYYTGMRRGEILGLKRSQVNLRTRIITLAPTNTKECHWKRIPLRGEAVDIIHKALRVAPLKSDLIFRIVDSAGVRPILVDSAHNCWPRACNALNWPDPRPRYHDLRHTWKTNARRSGMDPEIREAILGHADRARSVSERYGRISDAELINAIDGMIFDNGTTEIYVAGK